MRQVLLRNLVADPRPLPPDQRSYVKNLASLDFVVYNRVSNRPVLAIEVDGFKYHEDDPAQTQRDVRKDAILRYCGLPLLRLPTTGSGEERRIREALAAAERLPADARAVPAPGSG